VSTNYIPYSKEAYFPKGKLGEVLISTIYFNSKGIEEMIRDRGSLFSNDNIYLELRGLGNFILTTPEGKSYLGSFNSLRFNIPIIYKSNTASASASFSSPSTSGSVQISTNIDELNQNAKITTNNAISLCGKNIGQSVCDDIIHTAKRNLSSNIQKWQSIFGFLS
jgi:hypothetical protein